MHDDIVPELLNRIQQDFNKRINKSAVIKKLKQKLSTTEPTYIDVNNYAIEMGNILSDVINKHITTDTLPDGRMYYNIANRLLNSILSNNYELITHYGTVVQQYLNNKANIHLKPQIPVINQNKIDGLVNRLSSEENFEKVKWLIGDPIVTFSQGVVDDMIEQNVEFHYKSGLKPQIIRKESGNCCEWCRALVGTFNYPDVPKDVYKRHGNCRCTVEYDPKNGKRQNVHSKQWESKKMIPKHDMDKEVHYKSVKKEWLKNYKKPQVMDMTFFEHGGVKYQVDGKNVKFEYDKQEIDGAEWLSKKFGVIVQMVPKINKPEGIKVPDYLVDGVPFDRKGIRGQGKNVIDGNLKKAKLQAQNILLDVTETPLTNTEILNQLSNIYKSDRRGIDVVIIKRANDLIDVLKKEN